MERRHVFMTVAALLGGALLIGALLIGLLVVQYVIGLLMAVVVGLPACLVVRNRRKRLARQRAAGMDGAAPDLELNIAHNQASPQLDVSSLGMSSLGCPRSFTYDELLAATKNFDQLQLLGKGGSGHIFKGELPNPDHAHASSQLVAVKCIDHNSSQGIKEFMAELTIISALRHRNLVKLRGWCHISGNVSCQSGRRLLLVYDLMLNGSLDRLLFDDVVACKKLTWPRRLTILQGLASALQYLHEECEQVILHRDVKSSNVMLDEDLNARLGDFGLSRQVHKGMVAYSTTLAGTRGYLAPELCFGTSKATKESDMYSFGAVLLEVACGKRALDPCIDDKECVEGLLVDWVWALHSQGKLLEAADARLGGEYDLAQMWFVLVLGLACSHPDPKARPTIRYAFEALQHMGMEGAANIPLPSIPLSKPTPSYNYFPAMAEGLISSAVLRSSG